MLTLYVVLGYALSRLFYLFQIYTSVLDVFNGCSLGINRVISKGISNIYFKVTIEKT